MKIKVVESIEELKRYLGLRRDGLLLETDLDLVETDCDHFGRKRRDAEVLCTLAAKRFQETGRYNSPGNPAVGEAVALQRAIPVQVTIVGGTLPAMSVASKN